MGELEVTVALAAEADVGEAPFWSLEEEALVWVDITRGEVHRTDVRTGRDVILITMPEMVGAVVPRASGGLVAATETGFVALTPDGDRTSVARVEAGEPTTRMNDGKCDPQGRFWAGTMAFDTSPGAGSLYRLDSDHSVVRVLRDVTLSNGLGWSPNGETMYYIDSATNRIDAFDFNGAEGSLLNRRPVVHVEVPGGMPDGMTVDREGGLWVALWGGSSVHRYTPRGQLDAVVHLPASQVTSCTFGGDDLRTLFITSAAYELSAQDRKDEPLAGSVFAVDVGVAGMPPGLYGG